MTRKFRTKLRTNWIIIAIFALELSIVKIINMARLEPRFTLKSPNGSVPSEIRLRICYERKECVFHLVEPVTHKVLKILPQLWDREKQLPKKAIPLSLRSVTSNSLCITSLIQRIKAELCNMLDEARVNNIQISNEWLKTELNERLGLVKRKEPITVAQFILQLVKEMKEGKLLIEKTKKPYGKETIKQYVNLHKSIVYFDRLSRTTTAFDTINREWYDAYINFLFQDVVYIGSGTEEYPEYEREACAPNYAGNFIKNLKRVMMIAQQQNLSTNEAYKADFFIKPSAPTFGIFLSDEEIAKIYQLTLTEKNEKYDKYRDMFLIGCYTGLRVSDYTQLKKEYFKTTKEGNSVIDIITQKTGKKISLPIFYDELNQIAEKYQYNFPKVSAQKINENIKIIARMAGITEEITYPSYKGGKKVQLSAEKCDLISTHTGRRSAVTNLWRKGMDLSDIQLVTGQSCTDIVALYNKASSHEKADTIINKFKQLENGTNDNHK